MRRLRPLLSLLLVVLVAAWGEGMCGPVKAAAAMSAAPCHEMPVDEAAPVPGHDASGHDAQAPHASACGVCPLCVPVTSRVALDVVRLAGPPVVLDSRVTALTDRPGARPPVPPPKTRRVNPVRPRRPPLWRADGDSRFLVIVLDP